MNSTKMIGVTLAVVTVSATLLAGALAQAPAAPKSAKPAMKGASRKMAPKFEVDASWPHIPNGWTLGQVASAASDPQTNHIWILQRYRNVKPGVKSGPPVMEFDQAGNYIQGWGGPKPGYDWPSSEHGIYIDYKGFVWIGGQGSDDEIFKFKKDGTFVMQIGKSRPKKSNADTDQFFKPADVFVYPKTNELFVADGYGNHRIIVFDADTGAYKRMWGAYGKPPQDDAPKSGNAQSERQANQDPNRKLATDFTDADPGDPQFSTIHGVKVSNDGLVYAADRGGKRVQVFTTDGKYINQIWIDRWCEVAGQGCGNGQTAASVAFSADPEQRFLYVASRSPGRIWVYDRKTLEPLESFGRLGIAPGEFDVLHHMTTDEKGNLYTSEVEDGRRVQKFVFKGLVPAPASPSLAAK